MDPSDGFGAQSRISSSILVVFPISTQGVIHLLQSQARQFIQGHRSNSWDQVVPDEIAVLLSGGFPEIWLGVELIPRGKPLLYSVRFPGRLRDLLDRRSGYKLFLPAAVNRCPQLAAAFCLCFCQDIFIDQPPSFRITARGISPFPTPVAAFSDAPLPFCSAPRHAFTSGSAVHPCSAYFRSTGADDLWAQRSGIR